MYINISEWLRKKLNFKAWVLHANFVKILTCIWELEITVKKYELLTLPVYCLQMPVSHKYYVGVKYSNEFVYTWGLNINNM